jgi:hypothetical protein
MRHEAEAGTEVKSGMQLKVQIMVNSEQGQSEVIQEVAPLERGALFATGYAWAVPGLKRARFWWGWSKR